MLITVGILSRHADGCLTGILRTLTIRTQIELRPVDGATSGPDFEVVIGSGFVAGYAVSDGASIDIVVASLEFVHPVRMRAVPKGPIGDEWLLVWNATSQLAG